jgi:acetoin:2,6-dichlorophenolindophenol oxidoreductase subunit alpha
MPSWPAGSPSAMLYLNGLTSWAAKVKPREERLGAVDDTVKVIKWRVEVGQLVERGQPLLEVETDKSIMELESAVCGVLQSMSVAPGGESAAGEVIATFAVEDDLQAPSTAGQEGRAANSADSIAVRGAPDIERPEAARTTSSPAGDRVSFFERNRRAREQLPSTEFAARHTRDFLLDLYRRMVLIREFEEGVKFLFLEGAMPGTIHQCQGQEATAVGVCAALELGDFITSTFRGHGHALAKGLSPEELLFELFGASTGCCRGKGGSMHVGNMDKGMVPGIAIVGGGIPLAAGMALAMKMQKSRGVITCFFGDGAVAEGAFHEGINLAAIWDLPVIFVCENNLYGASTRVDLVMKNPRIADRAAAYGIRGQQVDGNDVVAVYEAARSGVNDCRAGRGPVLLELLTYRRTGHSRRDSCHYQPADERAYWLASDPIERLAQRLIERGLVKQTDLEEVRTQIQQEFQTAVEEARRQPLPSLDELTTDVFA